MTTNFEAKLHGFRRTQDGVVVSYVVHPSDVSAELATAALGTRYMVAVAEIGDDERPKELAQAPGDAPVPAGANGKHEGLDSAPAAKRKFSDLPLSQQCAMRCRDERFWNFLSGNHGIVPNADWPTVAASYIRTFCAVASRGEIGIDPNATAKWVNLEAEYQSYLTDEMYAGAVR